MPNCLLPGKGWTHSECNAWRALLKKKKKAHKAYAKYRSYSEMLNFAGLLSDSGCGGAGAGAGAGGVGGGSARANDDSNGNIGAVDDDGDASATTPRVAPFKTTDDVVNAAEVMGKTSLPESNDSEDNDLDERSAGVYSGADAVHMKKATQNVFYNLLLQTYKV